MAKIDVAICGGSGYTGSELLRILYNHPEVNITIITSERFINKDISDHFPHLQYYKGLKFEPLLKKNILKKADFFFLALPHSTSQEPADFFLKKDKRVIDLSADYRLKNTAIYKKFYGIKHKYPLTLKKAVYGLPELCREQIKITSLIANPGCYPVSVILALYPAIKHSLIDINSIIIDSKSGLSGAGRKLDISLSYCEANGGFRAYNVTSHRHRPEIEQELSQIAKKNIKVNFTPHLIPVSRGILSTIYACLCKNHNVNDIIKIYKKTYKEEPFIRILEKDNYPDIKNVFGTNNCDIGITINKETNTLVIFSAIDNLVKGAAGQAIQNMNIMLNIEETTALKVIPTVPY